MVSRLISDTQARIHVGYMVQSENGKFVVPDLTLTYKDKKARQPRRIKWYFLKNKKSMKVIRKNRAIFLIFFSNTQLWHNINSLQNLISVLNGTSHSFLIITKHTFLCGSFLSLMQYILLSFKRMYIYIYNIIIHILYFLKKII